MQTVTQAVRFAKPTKEPAPLPPMRDEPNQAEIDAKQAQILREAAKERRAWLDAHIDATDVGHLFGYEDATEDRDQCGSAYFYPDTPAWHAYNEGYMQGCIHLAVLTGKSRSYWLPEVRS